MENKKIKNATKTSFNGIEFKSKLEVTIYKTFLENGFNPTYECQKYVIFNGFKPTIPLFIKDKKTNELSNNTKKIIDVTYTPDLYFEYNGKEIFVEIKPAFTNDVYPYKRKMFRKLLEEMKNEGILKEPYFFQIGSKREVEQLIKIIKDESII